MKKHHPSLAQRTITTLKKMWSRRQSPECRNEDLRGRKKAFLFESLENRSLMAGDLGNLPDNGDTGNDDTPGITSTNSAGEASVLNNDLVAFAKALANANIKFYGAAWCPHCTATKNLFEDGGKYLPFIEVTNPDKTPNAIALANNITTYPTWVFQDGSRLTGELTLQQISDKAGIAIPQSSQPFLAEIDDVTLLGGSPLMVGLDGYDPNGGAITYTVSSDNPNLVTPTVLTGNQSIRMNVAGYGTMTYQLFDNYAPRVTAQIKQLISNGFYNGLTFHRVINDFVIQGGDPTGTGSGGSTLGDFDDQFNINLQHNRSGLLSMAKSLDDTNDSQFFVTEELNQGWFVTLNGSPTGGTFTLSYQGQTTAAIAFNNSSMATTADSMQSALAALTKIGAGNIKVTHTPLMSGSTVTENRRFYVEFTNELGKQNLMPVTGSGTGLTGGTSPNLSIVEGPRSSRHLDFNHSIFGALIEGEAVRDAISNVPVNSSSKPLENVIINTMEVFNDVENGMLQLSAAEGATGSANITVTATDADGQTTTRTFRVDVRPDTKNGSPFLSDIPTVNITAGGSTTFQMQAVDAEGQAIVYEAVKPTGNTVDYTLSVNNSTGQVTITPPASFVGTFNVIMRVKASTTTDTNDVYDSQLVKVNVGPTGKPVIDLNATSDTGASSTDNVTNASTLSFTISNVTNGATVKLYNGNTVIAQGVASGTSITLSTVAITSLGTGTYQISATQTVSEAEGERADNLELKFDNTAPGAITSTVPAEGTVGVPYVYNVQSPDEGTAGLVYSLVTGAPAGVSINSATGVVTWTPAANQTGSQTFTVLATDLAGNSVNQAVTVNVAAATPKDVDFILRIVDANGNVLNNLTAGQEFFVEGYVADTRPDASSTSFGVFAFYADINYSSNVQLNGAIQPGTIYGNRNDDDISTPGLIDELSGVAGLTALGRGEKLFVRIPMKVIGTGTITITSDAVESTNADISLYGAAAPTDPEDVNFGTAVASIGASIVANNDTFNFDEDSTNQVVNPITNDTVTGGSTSELIITAVGATSNGGTVTIASDGKTILYTPAANYAGLETFTYTVKRGTSTETSTATISVQVQPKNDPPNGVDDTATVSEDSTDNSIDVLANDTSTPDTNETRTVSAVTQGNHGGTITIGPGGNSVKYTPAANFKGTETFTYTVRDSGGLTDTATVTVTVTDANDNPVAVNDTATTTEDIATAITISVLANDNTGDETGETLTVTAVGTASNGGTVAVVTNGTGVTYKPAANFSGTETFTYTISDGHGGTATATVTVTVTAVNDPPTATNDTLNAFKNSTTTLQVLANDSSAPDPSETFTVTAVTQGAHGTIAISPGGGSVTYTPAANYTGSDTFTYTITDAGGLTATATVTVTVQDFVPSSLAGYVFKNGASGPLAGVTITLTGTDVNNATVSRTMKTDATGAYKFDALIPGTYKIKETQPTLIKDGTDTIGSQGGTVANDEFTITLAQGTDGTNNNFGEGGVQMTTTTGTTTTVNFRKSDLFSHNSSNYVLAAVDNTTGSMWISDVGTTFADGMTSTTITKQTGNQLKIEVKNGTAAAQTATVSANSSHVRAIGTSGNTTLYRLRGNSSFYGFAPATASSTLADEESDSTSGGEFIDDSLAASIAENNNNGSAGEYVDPNEAAAVDALMAIIGSDQDDQDDGNDSN